MTDFTWCSFANDDGNLGIVILKGALDPIQASLRTHELGINPGGELLALIFNDMMAAAEPAVLAPENQDRLIPIDEAKRLFEVVRMGDLDEDVS